MRLRNTCGLNCLLSYLSSSRLGDVVKTFSGITAKMFTKNRDIIALITSLLSKTDYEIIWLTNHARANDADTFFRNVSTANFSSDVKRDKLEVFRHHLKSANRGFEVQDGEFHDFLKHFYLLGYDLGEEEGVVLSLITSHISQFNHQIPRLLWSRILEFTSNLNHHAGIITPDNLPDDLMEHFKEFQVKHIPEHLTKLQSDSTDWTQHPDASYLALAILIGAWNEKNKNDIEIVTQLLEITYDVWLQKAREILHCSGSPLSLKNGIWKINSRSELWKLLGLRILDQNLDIFKSIAVSVLTESDPALELPSEERYMANIRGKVLEHSDELRKGIAEGLAVLGSQPKVCSYCSIGNAEKTVTLVIRKIFDTPDWNLWASLNDVLPLLAEAAPNEFLNAVEKTLCLTPCPFDELFAQESGGFTGKIYLTGLLWALEGLAWDENYFVRVCVALGDLANRDPGGNWVNRPSNSLVVILLPWLPQTLASIDKRKVAVETLLKEQPTVGWSVILQLLPSQHQVSASSYQPNWRKIIPDNLEKRVTNQEYWQQVSYYAELAVKTAGYDILKLTELIDRFDNLPQPAFDQLVEILTSQSILELPEEQRHSLWNHLIQFTKKHRRFADAEWALPDEPVSRIEKIANQLAPTDLFYLYQHLFSEFDFDLHEEVENFEEQEKKLDVRRESAINEIFRKNGIEGVVAFSETVISPHLVGFALAVIEDEVIVLKLLPNFLDTEKKQHELLVNGFIWKRCNIKGWEWCDNLDKSRWTPEQITRFLTCLPFTKSAWDRASHWLEENEKEYWSRVNSCPTDGDFDIAIEKFIEYDRPYSAINCLTKMLRVKKTVKVDQCVQALLNALSCKKSFQATDKFWIVKLIKFLQSEPSVSENDLFKVEWAYLPLLDSYSGVTPKLLESKLASDPKFFCEVIRLVYRSTKESQSTRETSEKSASIAINAYHLLRKWKTPPGTEDIEAFNTDHFNEWLTCVKTICTESGHLKVAMLHIGEVLIYAPADQNGLWIHQTVAHALNVNDPDAEEMRKGFYNGIYYPQEVHEIDPSGTREKELAEQFNRKAEELENACFHRFSVTLKDLARRYEQEAERIQRE